MALTDQEKQQVTNGLMRFWSRNFEPVGAVSKADLLAAVSDLDDWIEANQATINSALPQPFRTEATLEQKTLAFCGVASMRVSLEFAKKIFGEVE